MTDNEIKLIKLDKTVRENEIVRQINESRRIENEAQRQVLVAETEVAKNAANAAADLASSAAKTALDKADKANSAAQVANQAAADADSAAMNVYMAIEESELATEAANSAASKANASSVAADRSSENADKSALNAMAVSSAADTAAKNANAAASAAAKAANQALSARNDTITATNDANAATLQATNATTAAQNAANAANASKASADNAAAQAQAKATLADQSAAKADQAAQGANAAKVSADAATKAANDAAGKVKADYATDKAAWSKQTADAAKQATDAAEDAENAAQEARDAADAIPELMNEYAKQTELDKVNKVVQRNDARLDIVESVLSDGQFGWDLVQSEAYEVPVTRNVVTVKGESHSFADLVAIEGKTVMWNQLANHSILRAYSGNYGTAVKNDDGSYRYTFNVGATESYYNTMRVQNSFFVVDRIYAHVYEIRTSFDGMAYDLNGWRDSVSQVKAGQWTTVFGIQTMSATTVQQGSYSYYGVVNTSDRQPGDYYDIRNTRIIDLTAMFGAGNEPTDLSDPRIAWVKSYAAKHQEFNPGQLVSAEVSKVESVGKNLFNIDAEQTPSGFYGIIRYDMNLEPNTSYTATSNIQQSNVASIYANGTSSSQNGVFSNRPKTVTTDADGKLFVLVRTIAENDSVDAYSGIKDGSVQFMLERGTVATDYSPYGTKDSISLPPLNLRSAGSVADRADFLADTTQRKTIEYDLGDFEWTRDAANQNHVRTRLMLEDVVWPPKNDVNIVECAIAGYEPVVWNVIAGSVGNFVAMTNTGYFGITDDFIRSNTPAAIREHLRGTKIIFVLKEPTEEPLDVPRSFVQAEPGGVIRFANEDAMPVPNAIQYPVDRLAVM